MNKGILSIVIAGAMFTSCSSNEQKAETGNAEKVEVVETNTTETFNIVKEGSNVNWRASHLGGMQPRFGKIFVTNASFLVNNNQLTNASVDMDMSSLTVESFPEGSEQIAKLEGHLKSPDFFDISKHPYSKFELTNIESSTGDYNSIITGNLTIADIAKSITFRANVAVSETQVSIQSEDFTVDRSDWNLTYNAEGTEGVPVDYLIANDMGFTINIIITK